MFKYNQQSQQIYEQMIDGKLANKKTKQSGRSRQMVLYQFI